VELIRDEITFAVLCAFALDLLLGDPVCPYHPVRLLGRIIDAGEDFIRAHVGATRAGGVLLAAAVAGGSFFATHAVLAGLEGISPALAIAGAGVVIYATLSVRDLLEHAKRVYAALNEDDLPRARQALSMMVGRDTARLDRQEIVRATVESVAESTVDGILAPLLFAFLGGAPLAAAYRAVNTLDSMVGHADEEYRRIGWASARLDDVANFIPARAAALLIPLASTCFGGSLLRGLKTALTDAVFRTPFSNSAVPEAAAAGAFGVEVGGTNYYEGTAMHKPALGRPRNDLTPFLIKRVSGTALACAVLAVLAGVMLRGWG